MEAVVRGAAGVREVHLHYRQAGPGFEKPEILPDVEELAKHYEAFFVAAVSARKPA